MTRPANTHHGARRGDAHGFVRVGFYRPKLRGPGRADVESAPAQGYGDESVGPAHSVKLGTEGGIADAVMLAGGVPGVFAHSAVLPFSQPTVLRESDGSDVHVHPDTTKERPGGFSYYGK